MIMTAGFSVAREALKGGLGGERIDLNAKTWSISRNSRFKQSEVPIWPIMICMGSYNMTMKPEVLLLLFPASAVTRIASANSSSSR